MEQLCASIDQFVMRNYGAAPGSSRLRLYPLRGGLESTSVYRVNARFFDRKGLARKVDFVVKALPPERTREAAAYRLLFPDSPPRVAPRLLGIQQLHSNGARLYLEWVNACSAWPWHDVQFAALVLKRLALVHSAISPLWFRPPHVLARWDYERELADPARLTLDLFEQARYRGEAAPLRRSLPPLRRLVAALPALRAQLLGADAAPAVLHGDAHTANVVINRRGKVANALLLDWGRTRVGSPLEDVASWLQTLGYWEAEAKRRHDTLLRAYLAMRGLHSQLAPSLRESYWIAAASNGLAGAIRYHLLTLLGDHQDARRRAAAAAALRDWMRVIRRADAAWRR